MGLIDYIIYGIVYAVIGLIIGYAVYINVSTLSQRKRRNGAVISGIFWPLIMGLFIVMLIDDLKDRITNGKD